MSELKKRGTRHWCITWNNPPKDLTLEQLVSNITKRYQIKYCVLANEIGKEKGTPHIQGFISFKNCIQYNSVKSLFNNQAYCEEMKENSNPYANEVYCKKDGNYVEYGIPPSSLFNKTSEEQNDNEIIKDIIAGTSFIELCLKYPKYIKYHYRNFKELYQDINKELRDNQNNLDLLKAIKDLLE